MPKVIFRSECRMKASDAGATFGVTRVCVQNWRKALERPTRVGTYSLHDVAEIALVAAMRDAGRRAEDMRDVAAFVAGPIVQHAERAPAAIAVAHEEMSDAEKADVHAQAIASVNPLRFAWVPRPLRKAGDELPSVFLGNIEDLPARTEEAPVGDLLDLAAIGARMANSAPFPLFTYTVREGAA